MQSCILGNPNSCLTMGHVEELLVAEELWNDHKKLFFFPFSSTATCTNHPIEVDQRRRPCEGDGPIGHILRSCHDSTDRRVLKATKRSVATLLLDLTTLSLSLYAHRGLAQPILTQQAGVASWQGATRPRIHPKALERDQGFRARSLCQDTSKSQELSLDTPQPIRSRHRLPNRSCSKHAVASHQH
ncbi:hypothetical protein Taro_039112 [Colocasia esculenta]|uniref:Uncharacterized protein n=1 Tax=Colocasia esculenta TaxID=4460 RepID=A0A843WES4_COLES|nr:hypothetical protein [Colocasia esculenta]